MNNFTLKELRKNFKKTQENVADILEKTVSAYNMIENGKRKLSLGDALKLAEFYKIKVEEITLPDNVNGMLKK